MIFFLVLTIFPFLWMVRTAFSTTRSLPSDPASLLPVDFTLGAFKRVLGLSTAAEAMAEGGSGAAINFWHYFFNSMVYSTAITIGQVTFSSMAAYAFSRLRWRGRDAVFAIFLGAMLVPPIFTSLPNFMLIKNLGLLNSYVGMVLPTFFMTPFAIFFMRQFFLNISREVEESAEIDGAGPFRIFFTIDLPILRAPLTTLTVLVFITAWNDYFWPLLAGNTESTKVLTVALGAFRAQTATGSPDWAGLMAATLIAALPVFILFMLFAPKIVDSISYTSK
ncbi:MAG: carbohydrate ABC transporter permease [Actinomycetaceae bacterium]|nr:carbohydrate ABC transporter permease [Actinomycetaceae bacterium]